MSVGGTPDDTTGSYAGWYIGVGIVAATLAIGLALWFIYHP
jgi:hypothetical protein